MLEIIYESIILLILFGLFVWVIYSIYNNKKKKIETEIKNIDKKIIFLLNKFKLVRPKNKFIFKPTPEFYRNLELICDYTKYDYWQNNGVILGKEYSGIRRSTKLILSHLNINMVPRFRWWFDNKDNNKIAFINEDLKGNVIIHINFDKVSNEYILAAVLCHEITHYFLFSNNIIKKNNLENEKLTDLASVYLGFGIIMLNGYRSETIETYLPNSNMKLTSKFKVGYLSLREIAIAYSRFNLFYGIPLKKSYEYLLDDSSDILSNVHKKLYKYIKKNINKKYTNKKVIMRCYNCNQKLRFPRKQKDLKIYCPKCNKKIVVYADYFLGYNNKENIIHAP